MVTRQDFLKGTMFAACCRRVRSAHARRMRRRGSHPRSRGLTCDPAGGLVQIPCIERNAMAASRAIVAAEMSMLGDGRHLISFDKIVRVMLETGHDLPSIYRETSKGGIVVHFAGGC